MTTMPVPVSNDLVMVVRVWRHAANALRQVSGAARLNARTRPRCWKTFVNGRQGLIVAATQKNEQKKQPRILVRTKDVMLHEAVATQIVVPPIPAVVAKIS